MYRADIGIAVFKRAFKLMINSEMSSAKHFIHKAEMFANAGIAGHDIIAKQVQCCANARQLSKYGGLFQKHPMRIRRFTGYFMTAGHPGRANETREWYREPEYK